MAAQVQEPLGVEAPNPSAVAQETSLQKPVVSYAFEALVVVGLWVVPLLIKNTDYFLVHSTASATVSTLSLRHEILFAATRSASLVFMAALIFMCLRFRGEPLGVLSVRPRRSDFIAGVLLVPLGHVLHRAMKHASQAIFPDLAASVTGAGNGSGQGVLFHALGAFHAASMEELVVRAYLQTRLTQAGWRPWVVVLVSAGLQTSYHIYQGGAPLPSHFLNFLVCAALFQVTRCIWPIWLSHLIWDLHIL